MDDLFLSDSKTITSSLRFDYKSNLSVIWQTQNHTPYMASFRFPLTWVFGKRFNNCFLRQRYCLVFIWKISFLETTMNCLLEHAVSGPTHQSLVPGHQVQFNTPHNGASCAWCFMIGTLSAGPWPVLGTQGKLTQI